MCSTNRLLIVQVTCVESNFWADSSHSWTNRDTSGFNVLGPPFNKGSHEWVWLGWRLWRVLFYWDSEIAGLTATSESVLSTIEERYKVDEDEEAYIYVYLGMLFEDPLWSNLTNNSLAKVSFCDAMRSPHLGWLFTMSMIPMTIWTGSEIEHHTTG